MIRQRAVRPGAENAYGQPDSTKIQIYAMLSKVKEKFAVHNDNADPEAMEKQTKIRNQSAIQYALSTLSPPALGSSVSFGRGTGWVCVARCSRRSCLVPWGRFALERGIRHMRRCGWSRRRC